MWVRIVTPPGPYSGGDDLVVGQEYDMTDDQAGRWIRRAVAIPVERHQPEPPAAADELPPNGFAEANLVIDDSKVEIVRASDAEPRDAGEPAAPTGRPARGRRQ